MLKRLLVGLLLLVLVVGVGCSGTPAELVAEPLTEPPVELVAKALTEFPVVELEGDLIYSISCYLQEAMRLACINSCATPCAVVSTYWISDKGTGYETEWWMIAPECYASGLERGLVVEFGGVLYTRESAYPFITSSADTFTETIYLGPLLSEGGSIEPVSSVTWRGVELELYPSYYYRCGGPY